MRSAAVLLTAAALAAFALLVRGQPDRPAEPPKVGRTITVVGTGTAAGRPDTARVTLGVSATDQTVPAARGQVVRAVRQVQAAVDTLKLPAVRTRFLDSTVAAQLGKDTKQVVGYAVGQEFVVRLTDADPDRLAAAAERVLDAALANGANAEGGVQFFLADDTALRRAAQQKAVEDALLSARAYAAGAKLTVADVVSIDATAEGLSGTSGNSVNPFAGGMDRPGGAAAPSVALSAGDWAVSSTVRVVCRY